MSDTSYNHQPRKYDTYDTYACIIKNLNEALNMREEHISSMRTYISMLESYITSLEHERDIVISENNDLYGKIKDMRRNKYKIKK